MGFLVNWSPSSDCSERNRTKTTSVYVCVSISRGEKGEGGPTETSVLLKGYVVVYDNCLHVEGGGGQRIEL